MSPLLLDVKIHCQFTRYRNIVVETISDSVVPELFVFVTRRAFLSHTENRTSVDFNEGKSHLFVLIGIGLVSERADWMTPWCA